MPWHSETICYLIDKKLLRNSMRTHTQGIAKPENVWNVGKGDRVSSIAKCTPKFVNQRHFHFTVTQTYNSSNNKWQKPLIICICLYASVSEINISINFNKFIIPIYSVELIFKWRSFASESSACVRARVCVCVYLSQIQVPVLHSMRIYKYHV